MTISLGKKLPVTVLVASRFAGERSVVTSVALSLAGSGSVNPAGTATVAVLVRVPITPGAVAQVAVKTACPPIGRSTLAARSPLPLAGQTAPPEPAQVQATEVQSAGKVSPTSAPVAGSGPAFVAVIV